MKNKSKKAKTSLLSVRIDPEVHKKIKEYCSRQGIFIKKFIENSAVDRINKDLAADI